jgi:cation transport ATPase
MDILNAIFLAMAAGIEKWSKHPLAQAIVARTNELKLPPQRA